MEQKSRSERRAIERAQKKNEKMLNKGDNVLSSFIHPLVQKYVDYVRSERDIKKQEEMFNKLQEKYLTWLLAHPKYKPIDFKNEFAAKVFKALYVANSILKYGKS